MAAIRVAQAPRTVLILGKEECGEGAVRSVLAEELVH